MPKAIVETRPNRKLTEFFTSKESESTMPSSSSSSMNKNATTKSKRSTQAIQVPNSKRSGNSSKPSSKQTTSSSQPTKVVNVVSAEDSDDDDIQLPAIILTSSQASVDTITLTPTPKTRIAAKPFRNSPLTPRQNLEFLPKHSITPVKPLILLSSPKNNTLKRSGSKISISKPASPVKRPRCRSPKEIVVISSDSEVANDGDDEKAPLSAISSSSVESANEAETAMDIDPISFPILSIPLVPFDSTITTPKSKRTNEIVPSSQHGEMETDEWEIDFTTTGASGNEKKMEKDSRLGQVNTDLSPCSARTLSIINQIKANAELEAAKEAKEANTRLSLGLTDNESDLSELSDSSDDLSLDLDTFMNDKAQTRSEPKPQPGMPQAQNVRRSARNYDIPAPNYKLKLSLVRDASPTPTARAPRLPQKCPLDKILKESAYLKASAEASRQASSRATSVDRMEETSSFSHPTSDDHHIDLDDSPFFDTSITIEDSTREGFLGKKASDAVGKILHDDREKRKAGTSVRTEAFSVWDDGAMVTEDAIPSLHLNSHTSPLSVSLQEALHENDYDMAALLIGSGTLYGLSQSSDFLSWLFKLVFTNQSQQLSTSAYKALLILQPGKLPSGWLTEQLLHSVLQRLGLRETILQVLNIGQSHGMIEDNQSKIRTISRLLTLLAKFARSQALPETIIPSITTTLLVLGLDELISSHLHCDIITTIEAILSEQKFSAETELPICKAVHQAIVKLALPFNQQLRLIGLLSGSSPVSGRIRQWIAWSMLGGDLDSVSGSTDLSSSFSVISNLFSNGAHAPVKMIIHNEVDYAILGAQTEILSVFMTDVEGFARRPDGGNSGKEFVEGVFRNLANLLSKIYDTRAAHLDRSKTKDAMNRLRNRLEYQLEAAMHLIRPRKSVLHHFFEKKPKSVGAKS